MTEITNKYPYCDGCAGMGCECECYEHSYNEHGIRIKDIPVNTWNDNTCVFNGYTGCTKCNYCSREVAYIKK